MNIFRDGFCCCRRSATGVFIGCPNRPKCLLLSSIRATLFFRKIAVSVFQRIFIRQIYLGSSVTGIETQIRVGYELRNRIRCRPLFQLSSLAFSFFFVSISFFFSALFFLFRIYFCLLYQSSAPALLGFFSHSSPDDPLDCFRFIY